ncbi:MAG: hypothetical protein IK118_00765 [Clostridia bacterium]|nr:hypothetical protein [Clostridia bacterium]
MEEIKDTSKPGFSLDRFDLKVIAVCAMTVDHLAAYFIRMSQAPVLFMTMRCLGRMTAPIMCFFIAEGFRFTLSKPKYALRLAVFAVISQVPYSLLHFGTLSAKQFSVIANLFISMIVLCAYEYIKLWYLKAPAVLALIAASCLFCEWSVFVPVWVLNFYILRSSPVRRAIGFACSSVILVGGLTLRSVMRNGSWINAVQFGVLLIIPLILMYNGERGPGGKLVKYFFYLYYPLHLAAIYMILKYII